MKKPNYKLILENYKNIKDLIIKTPILQSEYIDNDFKKKLYFKCENLQYGGAFKYRGAITAIKSTKSKKVITHSSGNHATALSLAAKRNGIEATIVMPDDAPRIKINNVKRTGAKIFFSKATIQSRLEAIDFLMSEDEYDLIPPYNDYRIITGQGSVALEILEDISDLDAIIAPIGGGGLASGICLAVKEKFPNIKVYGAEPVIVNDAYRSIRKGQIEHNKTINTIADGLRTELGNLTFEILYNYIDDIFTVTEHSILNAMKMLWTECRILIEPSSAVALAALMDNNIQEEKIALIMTGGNIDTEPFFNNLAKKIKP